MPYTAVKERQRTRLTAGMRAILLLLCTMGTEPSRPAFADYSKRGRQRFFEDDQRWRKDDEDFDEEFGMYALCHGCLKRKRSVKHKFEYERKVTTAASWPEGNFRADFRFERADFPRLRQLLGVPAIMRTDNRERFTGEEALLIYLYR